MTSRAFPLAAAAAASLAVLAAVAVPGSAARSRPAPERVAVVAVEGEARSWDAGRASVALADVAATRGPRAARRVAARGPRLAVRLARSTVIVAVDDEGYREVIAPEDLFAELDAAGEPLLVEATGRIALPRGRRAAAARPPLTARRVVVHLPPLDEDDPYADDIDDLPDEEPVDEEPLIDPDDPGLG